MPNPPKGSTGSKLPQNKDTRKLTPKQWIDYNESIGNIRVPSQAVYPSFKDPKVSYEIPNNPNDHLPYISYNTDWPPKPTPINGTQPVQMAPSTNYNPNTGQYFNPITQAEIKPIIEQYYKGGKIKGGDPKKDETKAQREWLREYVKSDKYKERLRKEGFFEPEKEQQKRLENLDKSTVEYVKSIGKNPGYISGDNLNGHIRMESEYSSGNNSRPGYETIPIHEFGHSLDDSGNRIPLGTSHKISQYTDTESYSNPNKDPNEIIEGVKFDYLNTPTEFINRLHPIRYLLDKEGIYDAKSQDFNEDHYEKMINSDKIKNNQHFKDVMGKLKGNDEQKKKEIIDILNTIAYVDKPNSQALKKGGKVKGYANGSNPYGVQPNISGYQSPYTTQGQNVPANNRSGGGAKLAGAIGSTAGILGYANQAANTVKQGFDYDNYGYLANDDQRALNEVLTPTYKNMGDKIREGDYGGALKEGFLGAQFVRAGQNILGNDKKDTKFNRFFGVGDDYREAQKLQQEDEKLQAEQQKADRKLTEDSILAEKMALRDMGVTGLKDEYIKDPTSDIPQGFMNTAASGMNDVTNVYQNAEGKNKGQKIANIATDVFKQINPFKRKANGGRVGYNHGGDIKGPGGPKDDAIPAELEEGAFIVPNEKIMLAKIIRANMFPGTENQKASLKDSKSTAVPVRVSNEEHKFTKDEKEEIVDEMGEEVLEELAPEADELKKGGMVECKDGGEIPGYATGTNKNGVDPKKKAATKAIVESERGNAMASRERYLKELAGVENRMAKSDDPAINLVLGRKANTLKKYITQIDDVYGKPDNSAELAAAKRLDSSLTKGAGSGQKKPQPKYTGPSVDENYINSLRPGLYEPNPNEPQVAPEYVPPAQPQTQTTPYTGVDPNLALYDRDMAARMAQLEERGQLPPEAQQGSNINWNDVLGGVVNYGIPALQVGMGMRNLKKAGDRPVDQLDPDFLRSVSRSAGTAAEAKQRASYGLDADVISYLNQQNQVATRQGMSNARNYAGGSAANALSLSGVAQGDAYGRMLQTKISDAQAKEAKYDNYLNAQRYNDQLVGMKADMNRRLFTDNLNAWQQDTSSAANLAATGYSNAIEAYRGDQRLKNFNKIMSQSNPYQY